MSMLKDIRQSTSSFVVKLLLGILALSFVLFYGYESTTGCNPTAVAKVNGVLIQRDEYIGQVRAQVENYRRLLQRDIDDSMLNIIQRGVLDSLVLRVLVSDISDGLGLAVGDKAVRDDLKSKFTDPKKGTFDAEFYRNYIQNYLRTTPRKFEEQTRAELLSNRFRKFIESSAKVSESEVKAAYIFNNRQMNFDYVSLDPKSVTVDPNPADEKLTEYYEANKTDFKSEEKRQLEYAIFKRTDFTQGADGKQLSDKDIDDRLKAEAEKLAAMIKSKPDVSFKEHVESLSATYEQTASAIGRSDSIASVADSGMLTNKGFQIAEGQTSDPFKGFVSGNYYVVRPSKVNLPAPMAFEEAKNTVLFNFLENERKLKADRLVDEALAGLQKGESIEQVAKSMQLEVGETGLFKVATEKSIPKIGYGGDASEQLSALVVDGDEKERLVRKPIRISSKLYVFRAKEEKLPTDEEVNKGVPDEMAKALSEKQRKTTSAWLKAVRDEADAEKRVELYAQSTSSQQQF